MIASGYSISIRSASCALHIVHKTICAVRSISAPGKLVQMATVRVQHMQKALDQMNIQLTTSSATSLALQG